MLCLCNIVNICRCHGDRVNQSAACIYTNMTFHPKPPFVSFLGLVHFRITRLLGVFGGAGSVDNGRIYNGAALHHVSGLHHNPVDCIKKQLVQAVCFQQMAEFAQRCFIRNRFRHEVNAREFSHGIAVVNGILCCWIRQVKPDLKQIHPQHFLDSHGRTATLSLGIVRLNDSYPLIPRNNLVHDFQKFLPLGFLLAASIFHIRKCFLFHCYAPPLF